MTLATFITMLRIVAIPILITAYYWPSESAHFWAAMIFGAAALTDWLDGYLARRMNQVSSFGQFLDPVADKLMVAVALILLLQQHPTVLFSLSIAVIICREITISALRERMAEMQLGNIIAVSWLGKWKTTFQMLAIFFLLWGSGNVAGLPLYRLGLGLFYIAVVLTIVSMISYLFKALPPLWKQ